MELLEVIKGFAVLGFGIFILIGVIQTLIS